MQTYKAKLSLGNRSWHVTSKAENEAQFRENVRKNLENSIMIEEVTIGYNFKGYSSKIKTMNREMAIKNLLALVSFSEVTCTPIIEDEAVEMLKTIFNFK